MIRFIGRLGANLLSSSSQALAPKTNLLNVSCSLRLPPVSAPYTTNVFNRIINQNSYPLLASSGFDGYVEPKRSFHAAGSKVHYLDFRYRHPTNHLRLHLLIIRHKKMKKHQRRKFRRKFKFMLQKRRMKREIAKEKLFRVELLSMIRKAENFDPKQYALKCINELNSKPKELSGKERYEELKELIRINRYQVEYVKPKHRRAEGV